jgi:hypothetical protein
MTFLWFLIWFVASLFDDWKPLTFDPINVWAGTFLFVVALDLARQHTPVAKPKAKPNPTPPA